MSATVTVGHPVLPDGIVGDVPMTDVLVLTCSECGELSDWDTPAAKHRLQGEAFRHAWAAHDGVVEREGWT